MCYCMPKNNEILHCTVGISLYKDNSTRNDNDKKELSFVYTKEFRVTIIGLHIYLEAVNINNMCTQTLRDYNVCKPLLNTIKFNKVTGLQVSKSESSKS